MTDTEKLNKIRELFREYLVAEVKLYEGIPPLKSFESQFRMKLAELLYED